MTLMLPLAADDDQDTAKKDAVAAMQKWLVKMDCGNYAQTWRDASKDFQKAIPSEEWVAVSTKVRMPQGKVVGRKLVSALYSEDVNGTTLSAPYVVAQFDTSFENPKYGHETVVFEKEADGVWRAAGYYIRPQCEALERPCAIPKIVPKML